MESIKKMLARQIKSALESADENEEYANSKELEAASRREQAVVQRAEAAELQRLLDTYDK